MFKPQTRCTRCSRPLADATKGARVLVTTLGKGKARHAWLCGVCATAFDVFLGNAESLDLPLVRLAGTN